ncbi:MAG: preprotein translocase subunit SecG [Clostridia bacterium]|nr:preprotein translocase subunit SecG [Clostridia bacterium]
MSVIINIVLILVSLVLIAAVLMQEGNKQGLGAIGGAAETFLGKNKSKSYEGKLLKITKIGAAVFVVLAIFATWYNAKTFTVQYFVDGEEVFPAVDAQIQTDILMAQLQGTEAPDPSIYDELSVEDKRATYAFGAEVYDFDPPAREGYVGTWDQELPETMNRKNYKLNAIYTKGVYTLTFMDGELPTAEEPVVEGEDAAVETEEGHEGHDHEAEVKEPLYTVEYEFEAPIDTSLFPALPTAPDGYSVAWDQELPTTMVGYDLVITAVYTDLNAEAEEEAVEETAEETAEETTEEAAEEVPAETAEETEAATEEAPVEETAAE